MIVWFNCKISDIRPNPQPRYNLRHDNRFDVARYSFASFAPLSPLVSKFIFNLEMADAYAGREADMESWIRSVLPEDKLEINWFRCNTVEQWQELCQHVNDIDDDLIFPAGNEDHIFMDSNTEVFAELLELVRKDPTREAVLMTSHWPESIRAAYHFNGIKEGHSVRYNIGNNDALRVMKKEFFNWYVDQLKDPGMFVFRTEHWNNFVLPQNTIYVPTKEQFRHFDGYGHVGIAADYCPPLEIPAGFFEKNITVKYGFDDYDSNCLNINPAATNLHAEVNNGTDYRWCPEDIPAFLTPYIKEIITAPDADDQSLKESRDANLLLTSRLHFNWPHFGIVFNEVNYPSVEWLNPHMLAVEFTD
jgi:hypothetical protein